ncbi:MAG TPA: glycosyltransferase family 2 protein [Planctomycetaceae bacterium]
MSTYVTITLGGLVFFFLLQCVWLARFWNLFRRAWPRRSNSLSPVKSTQTGIEQKSPKVAVILSLRGADPYLGDCVRGLLQQNYSRYDVRIVVDSREDMAWDIVHQVIEDSGATHVRVRVLESRLTTCSLKSSALVQEISNLDDSYDVIAFLDADVIPYSNWLADLVAPFADPQIGATTGFRWYMPPTSANYGTFVRYFWNVGAIVQMYVYRIAWGGSLAIKAQAFREADLLQKWTRTLYEDVLTYHALQEVGLKLEFVPAVTMVNRETIDFTSCCRFIRRQMLNVRLYHRAWPAVLSFGVATTVNLVATSSLCTNAVLHGDWYTAGWIATFATLYGCGMCTFWYILEILARRVIQDRGEPVTPVRLRSFLAAPLAQAVFFGCLVAAMARRRIEWRGVTYVLEGTNVRMLEYRPYQAAPAEVLDATVSL